MYKINLTRKKIKKTTKNIFVFANNSLSLRFFCIIKSKPYAFMYRSAYLLASMRQHTISYLELWQLQKKLSGNIFTK